MTGCGSDPLASAIRRHLARKPFVWGESDCCMAVCDVLVSLGLPDPGRAFRTHYDDAAMAQDILDRGGALIAIASAAFSDLGWVEILPRQARRGDVGLVHAPQPALAIFDGEMWCAKTIRGLLRRRSAITAWATGYA